MRRNARVWGILLMLALVSSFAAAIDKPAAGQAATNQVVIGSQDAVTASDSGGGYLTNRDILLIVLIVLAIFGLAYIFG